MNNWSIYLLENTDNKRTYIGVTTDIDRRLRQHNGELVGGAKYTRSHKGQGEWVLQKIITDLTKSEACSLEKRLKLKQGKGDSPLERRLYLFDNIDKN